jgi:hypothetical protein
MPRNSPHGGIVPACTRLNEGLREIATNHADPLYTLTAQPSFDVPEFILKRLLTRDSGEMIEGLRREMAARAGTAGTT